MKVLKICIGTWKNASHDKRELSVCRELGAEVEVIAKGEVSGQVDEVDGFRVTRISSRPLGEKAPVALNRVISVLTWAAYIRKLNDVDIISGHDYIALMIGYLSNIGKRQKAKLVYDSHEFELERADANYGPVSKWFVCRIERFLIKRCEFSIMVSDCIANGVQKLHHLKDRPIVARNTPFLWRLDESEIRRTRQEILSVLNLPTDTFLLMFHGALREKNGIEPMLDAVSMLPYTAAALIGNESPERISQLHKLCEELHIADRVYFHEAVPVEELYRFVGAADVGTCVAPAATKNHEYMLPNKLFENIQSMTPVIVSDNIEMAKLVRNYGIGLVVARDKKDGFISAVKQMYEDKAFYAKCKDNLKRAKEELCWEKEKEVLKAAYREIMQ